MQVHDLYYAGKSYDLAVKAAVHLVGARNFQGDSGLSVRITTDDICETAVKSYDLGQDAAECAQMAAAAEAYTTAAPSDPSLHIEIDERGALINMILRSDNNSLDSCELFDRPAPAADDYGWWGTGTAWCVRRVANFMSDLADDHFPLSEGDLSQWVWAVVERLPWEKVPAEPLVPPQPELPVPDVPDETSTPPTSTKPVFAPSYRDQVWWRIKWSLDHRLGEQPQWAIDEATDECLELQERLVSSGAQSADTACRDLPLFLPGSDVGEAAQHDLDSMIGIFTDRANLGMFETPTPSTNPPVISTTIAVQNRALFSAPQPAIVHRRIAPRDEGWITCPSVRPRRLNPNPGPWGARATELQCDEYPFNKTYEYGRNSPAGVASQRLISPAHNTREGRQLARFYAPRECDVSDGEPFMVVPVPGVQQFESSWDEETNARTVDYSKPVMSDGGQSFTFVGTRTFWVCEPGVLKVGSAPDAMPRPAPGEEYPWSGDGGAS